MAKPLLTDELWEPLRQHKTEPLIAKRNTENGSGLGRFRYVLVLVHSSSGKIFFCFVRDSLLICKAVFIPYEKASTLICRGSQGCIARIGGRVRMGRSKARRNLAAAGRAARPGPVELYPRFQNSSLSCCLLCQHLVQLGFSSPGLSPGKINRKVCIGCTAVVGSEHRPYFFCYSNQKEPLTQQNCQ